MNSNSSHEYNRDLDEEQVNSVSSSRDQGNPPPKKTGGVSKLKAGLLIALTSTLTSILTWFAGYFTDHISSYTTSLYETKAAITLVEAKWVNSALITNLPLGDKKDELVRNLSETRVSVSTFRTNDARVDGLIKEYKVALDKAMGSVNRFDNTEESLVDMINSLQHAANVGGELGNEIGLLNASFKRKFMATLFGSNDVTSSS